MLFIVFSIEVDGEEAKMLDDYVLIGQVPFETLITGPGKPSEEEQCDVYNFILISFY